MTDDRTSGELQEPAGSASGPSVTDINLPTVQAERAHQPHRPHGWKATVSKVLHFLAAIFLFILAIQLMKASAAPIGARLRETGLIDNAVMTLGFGWFGAYIVLSGSPVAAVALTFFSQGVLTPLQTFTMLSGSRLGASFIVLLVGSLGERLDSTGWYFIIAYGVISLLGIPALLMERRLKKSKKLEASL